MSGLLSLRLPALACIVLGAAGLPLTGQGGRLLVLSKRNHTLSVVDPATLRVTATAPVGDDPHEVIASADGRTAYVSNYGFGAFHTLAVVDLASVTARPSIDLGPLNGPHGLAFADGELWFTAEGAKALGRYDPATQRVDLVLGTGQNRTHMIHVASGGEHLIVTNVASGTITLLDRETVTTPPPPPPAAGPPPGQNGPPPSRPRKDWNETVLKVGRGSEGFDLSPDGREIWVGNAQDGTISVIDYAAKQVVATLQADVPGANRLKFTPNGKYVLVSTLSGGGLVVLDAHSRQVVRRVPLGHGAAGILIEPGGKRAYVACSPDNTVAVVDLSTFKVMGRIDAGPEPDGMAWVPLP